VITNRSLAFVLLECDLRAPQPNGVVMQPIEAFQAVVTRLTRIYNDMARRIQHAALVNLDHGTDLGRVRAQQLRQLFVLTPWMMMANLANATIILMFFGLGEAQPILVAWGCCIWIVGVMTLVGWRTAKGQPPRVTASAKGTIGVTRHAAYLGALWGALPLIVLPNGGITEQVIVTNIIAGMAAAGSFALATIPAAATAYLVFILVPALIAIAAGYIPSSFPLFALAIIYFMTICVIIYARYSEFCLRVRDDSRIRKQTETISILLNEFEAQESNWLWETDAAGNLTYVPERLLQVTGLARPALIGRSINVTGGEASEDLEWVQLVSKIVQGATIREYQVPVRRNEVVTWWSITGAPIVNTKGILGGFRGVGTDITARKQAEIALAANNRLLAEFNAKLEETVADRTEEARRAAQEADEANQAKSLFLANMSHEIRSPMNGVFGMTDLLMRTDLSTHQHRLVSTIQSSAQSLLSVINDILDLSRIEAGKLEVDRHEFDLRHCLEGALELFAESASRKGIGLSLWVSSDTPNVIWGDKGRLRQVCVNLIGNAVKFSDTGEVTVRADMTKNTIGKHTLMIVVKDTGIGMDPAALRKLCMPFTQADSSISRKYGGTGLGLSISRHLIHLMGGHLKIESVPNQGTVISFSFDVDIGESAFTPQVGRRSIQKGTKVLIIDDRETNREILTSYLTKAGALTVAVSSGQLGLDAINTAILINDPFQAAVVDVVMPDMTGVEFLEVVQADESLVGLKTILVTSMSWAGDIAQVRGLGASALLTKPVREAELVSAVAVAVGAPACAEFDDGGGPVTIEQNQDQFNARVLVAEDNTINIEVARAYLHDFGCQVMVAENGRKAVAMIENQGFDVVLMDCQMPDMDGLTATRKIREYEQRVGLPRIPIIAVTANAFEEDRRRCLAAGMDDYLSKPYTRQKLAEALSRQLSAPSSQGTDHDAMAIEACIKDLARATSNFGSPKLIQSCEDLAATAKAQAIAPTDAALANIQTQLGGVLEGAIAQAAQLKPAIPVTKRDTPTDAVEELVRDFGADMASELIEIFIKDCNKACRDLDAIGAAMDRTGLKRLAHKLVGGASMIHATSLAQVARDIEGRCTQPDDFQLNDVTILRSTLNDAVTTFKSLNTQIGLKVQLKTA
jgi:PAS domain S-box-containing protein